MRYKRALTRREVLRLGGVATGSLTALKRQPETVWLNEASSVALQQELRRLDRAFINFFEGRAEHPKFQKKRGKQSAAFASSAFKWDGQNLGIAKMSDPLDIRLCW